MCKEKNACGMRCSTTYHIPTPTSENQKNNIEILLPEISSCGTCKG